MPDDYEHEQQAMRRFGPWASASIAAIIIMLAMIPFAFSQEWALVALIVALVAALACGIIGWRVSR